MNWDNLDEPLFEFRTGGKVTAFTEALMFDAVCDEAFNQQSDKWLVYGGIFMRVIMIAQIMHKRLASKMSEPRQAFRIMEQEIIRKLTAVKIFSAE